MFSFFKPKLRINTCRGIYKDGTPSFVSWCVEKKDSWGLWWAYDNIAFKSKEDAEKHMNTIYERGY